MTPYYPFDAYTSDPDYDFFKIANEGGISSDTEIDNDGEWLFSMAPVYDSQGNIVAVFEVGTNLYIFQEKTAEVIRNLLIDLLTLVIVIVLMSVEFAFLNQLITDRKEREKMAPHGKYLNDTDMPMVRPLSFLIFITVYMALAFIPLLAKDLARPLWGLDQSLVIGLPISAEVLASGVTMLFAGYFAQANGWKRRLLSVRLLWLLQRFSLPYQVTYSTLWVCGHFQAWERVLCLWHYGAMLILVPPQQLEMKALRNSQLVLWQA